jgi:hypothetical protein
MPSHKLHCYMDRMCFGRTFRKLHRALDRPYCVLGRKHRIVFHDGWSATEVAKKLYPSDPVAQEAAVLHIQLDEMCSKDKFFHDELKKWAELDAREQKRARGKGTTTKIAPTSPSLKKLEKTCKQLLEIEKLNRLIRS